MHIAFLNPQGNFDPNDSHLTEHPDFGGQLVYVKELALALSRQGHDVDIVTRWIDDPDWPEFAAATDAYEGFPENPRILRFECGGRKFLPKEELWPCLDEFVDNILSFYGDSLPDFTTAHYADGGYCAARIASRAGVGFTFTGHSLGAQKMDKMGLTPESYPAVEDRFHFSRRIAAERLSMERAARIIVSTDQERREQYAHPLYRGAVDPADAVRFAVVPPGVNGEVFTSDSTPGDAEFHAELERRVAGCGNGPFVVVSSRLDEKKNILGVVRAFSESAALRRRAKLALFVRGVDDPPTEIKALRHSEQEVLRPILDLIDSSDLQDHVRYLNIGSQRHLASAYRFFARRRSVFALPSLYEPFGLAPIEAAACGLACVATRNGGPSEIFADGSGVLVDPEDPARMAQGLIEALDQFDRLSAAGRRRVQEFYTWEQTARNYAEVIEAEHGKAPNRDSVGDLDAGGLIRDYLASIPEAGESR